MFGIYLYILMYVIKSQYLIRIYYYNKLYYYYYLIIKKNLWLKWGTNNILTWSVFNISQVGGGRGN